MWRRSKWLSLLLVLSITFLAIAPQAGLAMSTSGDTALSNPPSKKNATRLYELVDKRDQYSKQFQNSDGSITVETTAKPRHYRDSQGKWQDISNQLKTSDDPNFALRNDANAFQIHFANNSQAQFLARIKLDDKDFLAWNLNNANPVSAVHDTYSVTYPEILPNADLQYQPNWDGLKENLILNNINAPNAFRFDIKANGLAPFFQDDGSIAFKNSNGDIKMVIPKPFMYDQNKILSQNVSMTLSPTQSPNSYALFVTADLSWLGDSARAFPVVIDPNFTTANISPFWPGDINNDTYIHDTPPYYYLYNNTYMTTGHDATLGATRALVKFNLPPLPTGALIVGGTFSLNKTNNNVSNSAEVDVSRITSSWDPTTVNWSNKPSIDNNDTLTRTSKVNVGATTTGYINFDVGSIVKSWYNGNNVTNYGLEIVNNPETNTYFTWSSSDSVTNPPLLSITYMSDLLGINPKWSYANTPSGSVNTVNGNFLSSVTDFSWPGRGIPINVTRTYNSRATYTNFLFGPKWVSNLDMQLQVNSWGVIFIDAAGSEHTFFPNSDGTTYTSQDNYPVQLYKNGTTYIVQESYTAPGTTTLATGYQTQLPCAKFDANGLLTELDDGKGNATTLTHNGTTSIVVRDPSGRTLTLALSGGKVDHLTTSAEPTKNKVTYAYTNGNLTGVTYDNASYPSTAVQYDWTNGTISALTDKGGAKTYLTYDANNRLKSTGSLNLLSNPSFEAAGSSQSVDNWTSNIVQDSGNIQQTATSTPPLASNGFHSLNLHSNTQAGTSGDSYLYATQIIPVQPNHTYTLSGMVKTSQLGGPYNTDPNVAKAFLNVEQLNSSGGEKYQWVDTRTNGITGTTDWTARNLSVSTFSDTAYLKVLVEVQHDSAHFGGDAYFDSIQLEDNTNMLSRNQSDIETDASGWSANTGSTISRDTTQSWQGSASLKETVTSDSYAITPVKALTLPDQNNPSVTYTVSGYVNIPTPLASGGGAYLRVIQRGADNSVVNDSLSTLTQNLNSTTGWQRISGSFTLSYPTTTKTVELLLEASNAGTVYWDGLQLEKNSTPSSFSPGWLEAFQGHTDFRYFTDNGYQACAVTQPAGEGTEFINNGYGTPKSIIQDPNGKRAETDFVWDASDNLHQLTTPKGNIYTYTYDDVGNMIDAQDPNGKHESATYYYNETQTLTNALNKTVKNVWDPKNLNNNNTTDVNGNSQAFAYDDSGNMTSESNLLGIADNRVLNSDLESPAAPATPTFTRSSAAYKQDGTQVAANAPRYESGKYNQAVTIEEGTTNLLNSQGGGASTDWSKWSHWGNRSYWSSESQTTDPTYGKVYAGVNANSSSTYLYDYYPYTVTSGTPYTLSMMLKVSQNWTGSTNAYINRSSDNSAIGNNSKSINLTTSWQKVTWTITPSQSQTGTAGIGVSFTNLPAGVTLYASRPQLEQLPYATSFTDSSRSGESITLPTNVFTSSQGTASQGTIEAWVNPARNPQSGSPYIQMITDVAETGLNGLILALNSDGRFYIQAGTGSTTLQAYSTTTASAGNWYYVTGKWDGTGVSIYVNGVKQGTTAGTPNIKINSTPTIGRESQTATRWFDGLIDDVRISAKARPDTDIQSAYSSGQALPVDSSTTYKLIMDNTLTPSAAAYQPDYWYSYAPSGSTNQVESDSTAPLDKSKVLHINPGSNDNAYRWSDYIPVYNAPFALSGSIKTTGSTTAKGAALNVYWYDSTQTTLLRTDVFFTINSATDWQRYSTVINPPTNAAYAKVMAINYGSGSSNVDAYFDNIQFEASPQVRGYNFLDNSSFENQTSPRWSTSDSYASIRADSEASGSYDAQINLPATGTSYLESQAVVPVIQGQNYTLTGFIKTSGITANTGGGVRLNAQLYDGSGNYVNSNPTDLITRDKDWTKYAVSFTPAVSGTVKVRLEMISTKGLAKFDTIRLSPGQLLTKYEYDTGTSGDSGKNYVTKVTDPLNRSVNYSYTNDYYGQATSISAQSGATTHFTYDGLEQLRSVLDNAVNTTSYVLDANGNVTEVSLTSGSNVYDHYWFTYDFAGRLASERDTSTNNPTKYTYDEEGRLKTKTNPDNTTVILAYDPLGLLQQVQSGSDQTNYSYDLDGNRSGATVYSGSTKIRDLTFGYDNMGHLNSYVEKDGNNNILSQSSGVTYDDIYRLTGYNVLYGTNTALTYGFTYLNNDLPSTTTFNGKTVSFTYDDGNKLTNQVNPNNTEDIYTYNDAKQIVGVQTDGVTSTTDPLGNPITTLTPKWSSSYSYDDPDGRLTGASTSGLLNSSASYSYNNGTEKLNRLSHATIIDGTPGSGTTYNFDYTYDPAGNLLTMAVPNGSGVATNTFTYDSANELTTIKVDNNTPTSVLYDANGNLKQLTLNGKTYQYGYDASNRLVSVSDGTNTTVYTYGQDGQRLTKTTNGVTITYHYVNGQLAFETSSADASNLNLIHALYVRSPQGKLLAVSLNYTIGGSNNYYYYHYNAQGDVVAVTKDDGSIYRQYVYDPYGNVISAKDGSGTAVDINNDAGFNNAYTYRGYRYDSETGLYFLNSRYYAAGIGRFLTKDTWKGAATDPQTLNGYAYAIDDPVNFVDYDGHRPAVGTGPEGLDVYNSLSEVHYGFSPSKVKSERDEITEDFIKVMRDNGQIAKQPEHYQNPFWFKNMVGNRKPWDLKQTYTGKYQFKGRILSGADLGNIHYGFVGTAAGFNETTLLMGAGYAQIVAGTSRREWYYSNFDDPDDQRMIQWGIRIYQGMNN